MAEGALAIAGVALAIPGIVDLCIKYGYFLKEKYDLYQSMDEDMRLYRLIDDLVDKEMHDVLMFFTSVDERLSKDVREQVKNLLLQLYTELDALKAMIIKDPGFWQRLGYSAHRAAKIQKKCSSLEEWHMRFLRRATVLVLFGNFSVTNSGNAVEAAASRAVQRIERIRGALMGPSRDEVSLGRLPRGVKLGYAPGSKVWCLDKADGSRSVADAKGYGSASDVNRKNAALEVMKELALKLASADPKTMGMLKSPGFFDDTNAYRFILHFPYPEGMSHPVTLQQLLTAAKNKNGPEHSLSDRVNLAKKIASGLLFMHAAGFLHKKVNPRSVIVFERKGLTYPKHIGEPFLVGYDLVRKVDHASARLRTENWEENIYLHPVRHRLREGDEFTTLHDIYSLGVVLLEIACWSSFTDRNHIGKELLISETVNEGGKDVVNSKLPTATKLQERYLELAEERIPPILGTTYHEVVISCLKGLPNENGTPPDPAEVSGSAYIEQVMGKLEEISL